MKEEVEKILWHSLTIDQVFKKLNTSETGLTESEAKMLLRRFGLNELPREKNFSKLDSFLNQLKSPLVYVLIGAGVISFILLDYIDLSVILLAIFINTGLGFYQENKANQALAYLKKLLSYQAKVLRDTHEIQIAAENLIPGDIIFLEAGDKVPADCRLITSHGLQVNEAALTGESVPAEKTIAVLQPGTILADRDNMAYSGTIINSGKAMAVVTSTGVRTEIGKISQLIQEVKDGPTPLQEQLTLLSRALTYIVLLVAFIIVVIGKIQHRPLFSFAEQARESMLSTAAAVAVAAIPEGLLISVTVILAIGMQAILKKKALVRKLVAAETLGSVSIICTDKTGTLTEGKMQVENILTAAEKEIKHKTVEYQSTGHLADHDLILKICFLCNDAVIENPNEELAQTKIIGKATEAALLQAALYAATPTEKIALQQPRLDEIPFDSTNKYMATLHKLDTEHNVIYVKGAPEKLFTMISQARINGVKKKLTPAETEALKKNYEKLTNQGLRLLAFCYKKTTPTKKELLAADLNQMTFLGFVALKDPLRPEAKEAIELAKQAGIRPIIITGDHKLTAQAIMAELNMDTTKNNILEGFELDAMTDENLALKIADVDVYARVEPAHKLRIVKAWQTRGEVVAMTGDGVNDAPALKAADIGIALGSGTDVAKETADIILLDNNFKVILTAVEQGRVIFDNIKKVILYLLSDSFTEMILISGALLLGLPLPILPVQIIWVNLIADGLPNVALTFEPGEKEVMQEKPRKKKTKLLDQEMKTLIFVIAVIVDLILLSVFYYLLRWTQYDLNHIRTFIFAAVGIDSLLYVFSTRSLRHTILTKNPFSNKLLLMGVAIGLLLQLIAIYHPTLQKVFETVDLNQTDWIAIIGLAIVKIILIEVTKYYFIVKQKHG